MKLLLLFGICFLFCFHESFQMAIIGKNNHNRVPPSLHDRNERTLQNANFDIESHAFKDHGVRDVAAEEEIFGKTVETEDASAELETKSPDMVFLVDKASGLGRIEPTMVLSKKTIIGKNNHNKAPIFHERNERALQKANSESQIFMFRGSRGENLGSPVVADAAAKVQSSETLQNADKTSKSNLVQKVYVDPLKLEYIQNLKKQGWSCEILKSRPPRVFCFTPKTVLESELTNNEKQDNELQIEKRGLWDKIMKKVGIIDEKVPYVPRSAFDDEFIDKELLTLGNDMLMDDLLVLDSVDNEYGDYLKIIDINTEIDLEKREKRWKKIFKKPWKKIEEKLKKHPEVILVLAA